MRHVASSWLIIGNKMHPNWNVAASECEFKRTGGICVKYFGFIYLCEVLLLHLSRPMRSTENWVRIPLKENQWCKQTVLFAVLGIPSRAKDKTLGNFADQRLKFVCLLPGRQRAAGVDELTSPLALEPRGCA